MKLAVFGHYDSRGGTTGIPLPDAPTEADVRKAIDAYNKCFCWEQMLKEYKEKPEEWAWNPTEPGSSPGEQDFIFVADLRGQLPAEYNDLQDIGAVLIDAGSEPGIEGNELLAQLADHLKRPTILEFVPLDGGFYRFMDSQDESVRHAAMIVLSCHLSGGEIEVRDWNDDAFGFIIGTGLD